ncbi:MAG: class I SAM-dependent methyltransferase [Elusimicrobia bacterium]|nr:class I SAM-dependent methyltransferase [Elusimicrobiota bacterium]
MPEALRGLLAAALERRAELLGRLHAEDTDAYRLFHGTVEGAAGLTVDRYGDLLLVQSFHSPLPAPQLAALEAFYAQAWPGLGVVYNDRSRPNSRIANALSPGMQTVAAAPRLARELGLGYRIQGRHAGQDPWLFLDMRAARRRVMTEAAGKSLLNVFAYTCGVGVAAAKAGASSVANVDFSLSSLAVGGENARLNDLPIKMEFVHSDAFAALRQLSGLGQSQVVRGRRLPPFPKLEPRRFDLVFLDPPRYAQSPFGVVDVIQDYPAVFKPALLCVAEGGAMFCCNNAARAEREAWLAQLERSARKAGRPIREAEWIMPEDDFPSLDGRPPLKVALLRL